MLVPACAGVVDEWHTKEGEAKHHAALARLLQLRVLEARNIARTEVLGYALHSTLAKHLRSAVYGGCDHIFRRAGSCTLCYYGLANDFNRSLYGCSNGD